MTSTLPWDFLGCLKPPVEMVAKSPSSWIVSYWLAYLLSIYCLENTWKTDSQKFLLHNVSVSQVHHVIRWMYFLIIKNKRWIVAIILWDYGQNDPNFTFYTEKLYLTHTHIYIYKYIHSTYSKINK